MNLPRKCGNFYIKFDDNNNPEYGFEVEERGFRSKNFYIKKFHLFTDKKIENIILPKLIDKSVLYPGIIKEIDKYRNSVFLSLDQYLKGEVRFCEGCFSGSKKLNITVPFNGSIMLDWGCFEDDAEITFTTSNELALKQVYRQFDTGFDYERENWTLVADKNLQYNGNLCGDSFYVEDYNEDDLVYTVANIKMLNNLSLEDISDETNEKE